MTDKLTLEDILKLDEKQTKLELEISKLKSPANRLLKGEILLATEKILKANSNRMVELLREQASELAAFKRAVVIVKDELEIELGDYVQSEGLIGIVKKIEDEFFEVKPTWAQFNCQFVKKDKWRVIRKADGRAVVYQKDLKKESI